MKVFEQYEFWFITGSQHLYGPEVLKQVAANAQVMVQGMDKSPDIPAKIIFKQVVTTSNEIRNVVKEANYDDKCVGIITWCHTFSPSKMWISGLSLLNKPWLQLHTQFNEKIPAASIDMDFMNLNQAAHGDREHGFIATRMRKQRKIVVGYWEDTDVLAKIGGWMRSAIGAYAGRGLKVLRFGDNMRQVAVTEGDKVEAEIVLGWSINTHAVGDLATCMDNMTDTEVDNMMEQYKSKYDIDTDNIAHVRHQAKIQVAMQHMLSEHGADAFTTTFEDLHGLEQLPGLACQDLMSQGFGFAGEGDWKTSALTHIIKLMSAGMPNGASFMEDYTYDLTKGNEMCLGSHMLEICPAIAAHRPKIQVHPLGIGGKSDPARLVFNGKTGPAILISLVDMGGRMRLVVNDVDCVEPPEMPKLPVARVMWKPAPDLQTAAEAWMLAGGAHHNVISFDLTAQHIRDYAEILGIEFVHINKSTCINELKRDLFLLDIAWKLK